MKSYKLQDPSWKVCKVCKTWGTQLHFCQATSTISTTYLADLCMFHSVWSMSIQSGFSHDFELNSGRPTFFFFFAFFSFHLLLFQVLLLNYTICFIQFFLNNILPKSGVSYSDKFHSNPTRITYFQ